MNIARSDPSHIESPKQVMLFDPLTIVLASVVWTPIGAGLMVGVGWLRRGFPERFWLAIILGVFSVWLIPTIESSLLYIKGLHAVVGVLLALWQEINRR
jgi:hypothetical protein